MEKRRDQLTPPALKNLCFAKPLGSLTYLEHRGATGRATSLGRRLAVLHRDGLRVLHFLLGLALNAISFHL